MSINDWWNSLTTDATGGSLDDMTTGKISPNYVIANGGTYTATGSFDFATVTAGTPIQDVIKEAQRKTDERISRIEERLALFVPNHKLEAEYLQLKRLADQYRELESKIIEQERMTRILRD